MSNTRIPTLSRFLPSVVSTVYQFFGATRSLVTTSLAKSIRRRGYTWPGPSLTLSLTAHVVFSGPPRMRSPQAPVSHGGAAAAHPALPPRRSLKRPLRRPGPALPVPPSPRLQGPGRVPRAVDTGVAVRGSRCPHPEPPGPAGITLRQQQPCPPLLVPAAARLRGRRPLATGSARCRVSQGP